MDSRPRHEQGKNRPFFFDRSKDADGFSFADVLPALLAPKALLRYPTPNPPPSGRWLSRPAASKSDVTPTPHFLTSLTGSDDFWIKTASDVTPEPISVTSLNKNGIKDYYKCF